MAASDTSHDRPTLAERLTRNLRPGAGSPRRCAARGRGLPIGRRSTASRKLPVNVALAKYWHWFWRLVSRYMPKRLYARSLIIIITPMILLQSVVAFVFMERHWQTVTQRLSEAVVRDIAAIIDMTESYPNSDDYANVIRIAQDRLSLKVDIMPPDPLPAPGPKPFFSILDEALRQGDHRQDRPAVLAGHGRQLQHHRDPHPARRTRCCGSSRGAARPMPPTPTSSCCGWSAPRWCC